MAGVTEDGGSGAGLSSRQIWLIVGGLLLGTFLSAMDTLVVITALPTRSSRDLAPGRAGSPG